MRIETYNREQVKQYAKKWAYLRNPQLIRMQEGYQAINMKKCVCSI
ncbi:MAG: hypothetical protein HFJ26_06360 [Clostridia bacterium]|jgi:hypothetical protein|nr:hypothetical protein [Clostridia bacterium]